MVADRNCAAAAGTVVDVDVAALQDLMEPIARVDSLALNGEEAVLAVMENVHVDLDYDIAVETEPKPLIDHIEMSLDQVRALAGEAVQEFGDFV
jgi:hypothetical protein